MNTSRQEALAEVLDSILAERLVSQHCLFDELTIVVHAKDVDSVSKVLRDHIELGFDTLIDLCGMDYSTYGDEVNALGKPGGRRFGVVYHLLSIPLNQRLRMKVFAEDNEFPVIDSVTDIWPGANWFEREAFDLYGIVFQGHTDLRRILTDYGFVGNPFRKDFPISGYVEMRYDEEQKRVIYQPVSIEPREITPLVVREQNYGDSYAE
ncbi:NADH-quinone oxidoreductase subunit C [Nitrosomonas aestuarii]|uniref:NADH-quinone oxidoreductase subunit C n=1 Tax=Nitrosomonas aestuarii TaxID=52441 RepID=UPI000D3238AD|nr:NADH-quinone oxidoreductase subunit C [Nitrosomonas aestuarii]PTN12031.1 NADH dehydrogenase subunit C [Nitrosomonas aestuarii]